MAVAVDKLAAFTKWKEEGVATPEWWTNRADVPRNDNDIFLSRTSLRGSCGDGITVVRPGEDLGNAPLYVKYVRKDAEYRFHVVNGKVIFTQQKKKRNGDESIEGDRALIRNHGNGWIFASVGVSFQRDEQRAAAESLAVASVTSLGLDFGACDLIISKRGVPLVLEVNTAPGISSPSLLEAYTTAFKEYDNSGR